MPQHLEHTSVRAPILYMNVHNSFIHDNPKQPNCSAMIKLISDILLMYENAKYQ